jgi:hypothetical protein
MWKYCYLEFVKCIHYWQICCKMIPITWKSTSKLVNSSEVVLKVSRDSKYHVIATTNSIYHVLNRCFLSQIDFSKGCCHRLKLSSREAKPFHTFLATSENRVFTNENSFSYLNTVQWSSPGYKLKTNSHKTSTYIQGLMVHITWK